MLSGARNEIITVATTIIKIGQSDHSFFAVLYICMYVMNSIHMHIYPLLI